MIPDLIEITKRDWDNLYPALEQYALDKGVKKGAVLWIYRLGITASAVTPGGATEMARLLGKDDTIRRLNKALEVVSE